MERLIGSEREGFFLIISGFEFKHLKALRLRESDSLEVFWEGRLFLTRIDRIGKDRAVCAIQRELDTSLPKPEVILYQCLPLDMRLMEEIIDRVSQAGAVRLVPLICERSFKDISKVEHKAERWKRLSLASFKQCKRPKPLEIAKPMKIDELKTAEECSFVLDNFGNGLKFKDINHRAKSYGLVVGPEGGFSLNEVELLKDRGFQPLLLKPYIYRSEMAGAVAVAIIMNLAEDTPDEYNYLALRRA
ncbi:MAG: RsmE family RNA methyltransferase [Aquificaceae bacterium]|nr:RsmE family RNA methyltransferase [Aquificaceae bacterium]